MSKNIPPLEILGSEIYGEVLHCLDEAWNFIKECRIIPKKPPIWEEVRDTFIKELTEEIKKIEIEFVGEKAKIKTIEIILAKYPEVFPKEIIQRVRRHYG